MFYINPYYRRGCCRSGCECRYRRTAGPCGCREQKICRHYRRGPWGCGIARISVAERRYRY